ncbi:MAG: hypothetical protein JJT85_05920 [Chromatiales bacterium]|nr:hypothetical protein [Chromatiales bacterium]
MAYNRSHARQLCSAAEYELFAASLSDEIRSLTPARLKSKLERARKLRDKYRDLLKRQRLASRARTGTKKGTRPDSNARTAEKAKLFGEVLERLTARSDQLAAAEKRAEAAAARKATTERVAAQKKKKAARGPKKTRSAKAPAKAAPRGTAATGFTSDAAKAASRRAKLQNTRAKVVQGHVRAAGKRTQAKRDRRR